MKKNTLSKEERLCSKRSIDGLFSKGSSFVLYPFRFVFLQTTDLVSEPNQIPLKVLFSVPKRRIKLAVTRNLIKRRMREVYRLQKNDFLISYLDSHELALHLAIQYVANHPESYDLMYTKMEAALKKLQHEFSKMDLESN